MDRRIQSQLVRWLPSLEKEMLALRSLVHPGQVCLDVGASYGTYTVALARLVGPAGRVHAFEPRPRSQRVLGLVRGVGRLRNVEIHPFALSDAEGGEVIVTPRRRWLLPVPGRSFLKGGLESGPDGYYDGWEREFGGAAERMVPTETLDGFAARARVPSVDFLKIDVEGAELRVLSGATQTLQTHRPVVLCEIEDRHTRKYGHRAHDVVDCLQNYGYRTYVYDGTAVRKVTSVHPGENNYLFFPEGATLTA